MRDTSVTYVILGMLRLGPRSGYDVKQFVDNSTRFFWAASYGQIYPELRRLLEAGLIEAEAETPDGRRRKVYRLTAAGEQALHDWLVAPVEPSYELRDESLLKLFFADALTTEEALEIVRAMRRRHATVVERLRAIAPEAQSAPVRFPHVVLQGGLALHGRVVDWCDELERDLQADDRERA